MTELSASTAESGSNLLNGDEVPDIIKPINSNTVHHICSGQVVLSLAIAVKELVENAIDANATNIDIRLKEYGSEVIEVSDNGSGVRQENFQALTLKHYTSKLKQFHDLESLNTLGFRGEALSSLCALSELAIITRHVLADHGTKICYDPSGKICWSGPTPREIGTTVAVENLFGSLPVRRKEFMKNLKKEYGKMCQLLYAYCLVAKGIKFTCTNQTKVGSRTTVISTEGSNVVRNNIISVFGTKQIQLLMEVNMVDPDEQILSEYKLRLVSGEHLPFNFEFIISSAEHGSGRSTNDRQFFYINERPCEPYKIIKLVNEVYRQFNSHQYPFIFLNVIIEKSFVDVNVTPDKRQVFLEKEKLLLATLKTSLLAVFKSCPSSYSESIKGDINKFLEKGTKRTIEEPTCNLQKNNTKEKALHIFKKCTVIKKDAELVLPKLTETYNFKIITDEEKPVKKKRKLVSPEDLESSSSINCIQNISEDIEPERKVELAISVPLKNSQGQVTFQRPSLISQKQIVLISTNSLKKVEMPPSKRGTVTTRTSISYIKELLLNDVNKVPNNTQVRFRSEITPASNKTAEEELTRQITKDMFKKMEVIGQFNLGFIIAKLESDLFIVDQHATDEKYNFEQLQLKTVLESQSLVNPSSLQLSAANEELLIENVEVFQKNGFKFIIDPTAPATKKVKLSAIPISKNYIFGKDDIEEMLFMMQEEVNLSVCRPSRIRSMFASRACRKSVMVGYPLNKNDMRRLIDHMGEIDQPWNCPHGRPTIRHLVNLSLLQIM